MQQAVFMAHCPYELGDMVEIVMLDSKKRMRLIPWEELTKGTINNDK